MRKLYLKYDDIKNPVECDYGVVWLMLLIGCFYPLTKKDYKIFFTMLITQIFICVSVIFLIQHRILYIICPLFIFLINFLFAFNYNTIVLNFFFKKGYEPLDYDTADFLLKERIYFKIK